LILFPLILPFSPWGRRIQYLKIALFHPEIPQNTGNIGRLCVASKTPLYLVRPLGFFIDDKEIKRSGLDYWKHLDCKLVDSLDEIQQANPESRLWYLSTKGKTVYTDVAYQENDILVFGSEGSGLPDRIFKKHPEQIITIPMPGPTRSLNLATSVGIVVYEAFRQCGSLKHNSS
jgi:tRNA (cytidine/uridine-2'-O-)-methyltransferase